MFDFMSKHRQTPSECISSSGRYIIRSIVDETQLEALKAMSDFLSFNQQQHTHVIQVWLGGNFASTNQNFYPRNLDRNYVVSTTRFAGQPVAAPRNYVFMCTQAMA